jgi:hypothetical protein
MPIRKNNMFIEYFYNDHGFDPEILEWNLEYDKEGRGFGLTSSAL